MTKNIAFSKPYRTFKLQNGAEMLVFMEYGTPAKMHFYVWPTELGHICTKVTLLDEKASEAINDVDNAVCESIYKEYMKPTIEKALDVRREYGPDQIQTVYKEKK